MNDTHELLFMVATNFLQLNLREKMNVGMRLGLIKVNDLCYTEAMLTRIVFVYAYKNGKLAALVKEIERIKPHNG